MAPCRFFSALEKHGAGGRTRTDDLLITNQLLYQLSYAGRLVGSLCAIGAPKPDK